MTREQERRDPSAERVKVSTLVEVCGNIPGIPVFEAESVNLSQRGMQLRTAYLPEDGAPLVCRFESEGREIVVEGEVAWRQESSRGGEFGVKFTALDSRSVDVLRGLCGVDATSEEKAGPQIGEAGARVRLHIEGLGSPMKARVKTGGTAKVSVGSSLEFLKVGKRLEIEDLDVGGRRAAQIDGVSVVVDPGTRVPQLVVGLRFEGADETTPSPSTSSVRGEEPAVAGVRIPAHHVSTDAAPASRKPASTAAASDAEESDEDGDEPEMRGRVAAAAVNAGEKAKAAGESLARASAQAAKGASSWLKLAAEKVVELSQKKTPQRRTTAPAPAGAMASHKPKLRPQSGARSEAPPTTNTGRGRKLVIGAAGVAVLGAAAIGFAMRGPGTPPGEKASADVKSAEISAEVQPGMPAAAAAPALPGQNDVGQRNAPVSANVPLFGPTPLTTTEPAPLGPPPGSEAADIEASERAQAKASMAPRSLDEAFPGGAEEGPGASEREPTSSDKSGTKPEDVPPFAHGKLKEPTIHRLRLDGPGAKLSGTVEPTGFTVVIPSRKVMENGASIAKRDARIARIRAINTPVGAQVSFRFRESVPSYRVRLRRDNVEILISEPSPAKPAETSAAKTKKR